MSGNWRGGTQIKITSFLEKIRVIATVSYGDDHVQAVNRIRQGLYFPTEVIDI